ncbi:ABC transporter ATP-binding protein [Mesorhizobium sp. LHD-90]|uniref:ABC transporter ATP-binding protein n=1 Tax=Mesorhizobium sp. LHD-90 TaxID=3071414 RepID=UPI0027DFE709|nr:ABC transporter ATP-binding protein [Mesorhizobium sp. LHD-90]MDQ6433832.1 ABC transporter ATP-binding protein [Mesorhizobium sp. LHD-90]
MAQLEIVDVSKSYGTVEVLKNVNLSISSGEFVVFVGPSGCGKSTLLRMISGLEEIADGEIRLDGKVVNRVDPARRGVAMVFQSYALYPHMTAFQNMAFSLSMAREPKALIKEKVGRAAEILRLEKLLERRPGELSGGQKQRVAIGRAIVREPKVFLFDEPLSNLDTELRVQMRAELIQLHDKLGTTMIYVTHDQVEAMTLADKMVVMNGGIIQQCGSPLDLYDDPDNKFVAGFIGSPKMNFLRATVEAVHGGRITVADVGGGGRFDLPFAGFNASVREVELGIRPDYVEIASEVGRPGTLETKVAFVEELGDVTYIHTDTASGERLVIRSNKARYRGGAQCVASLDPAGILLFDRSGARIRSTH